ncbi:MAG: hypothetical protein ACP5U0_08335 [Caldisphaera sp.]
MTNISVFISTKDDIDYAIEPISQARSISNDIVIIDSSSKQNYRKLIKLVAPYRNIRVFWVQPLGHREPLFYYAINKCRNKWILHLNAFERMNNKLLEDLQKILEKADADVIKINSTHYDLKGIKPIFTSQNIFVLNKYTMLKKATGYIHYGFDLSAVKIITLGDKYNVLHLSDYMSFINGNKYKNSQQYIIAEEYEWRKTYGRIWYQIYLLAKWLYMGSKRLLRPNAETFSSKMNAIRFMMAHDKLRLKTFYNMPKNVIKKQLAIQQKLKSAGGPINYLHLHNDADITKLNKTGTELNLKGAKLFAALLEEKYDREEL